MSDFLNPLLRASMVLAVSAAIVWLALRVLKIRSAMVHQVAWSLVLLQGLILFPVALDLPVLPAAIEPNVAAGLADESSSNVSLEPQGVVRPDERSQPTAVSTAGLSSGEIDEFGPSNERSAEGLSVGAAAGPGSIEQPITVASKPASVPSRTEVSWSLLAGVVWFVGVVLLSTRAVWSYVRFLAEVRNATDAPEVWDSQWQSLLASHTQQRARMLCHETLGPMLCRTPSGNVLLVPEELWDGLSLEQRDGILRHELGHLQRRDILAVLFARVVAAAHWFNPLVWLAVSRFDESVEWACDERVVRQSPQQAPAFAKALLEMVQSPKTPVFGTTSAQGSPLGVRIRRLLRLGVSDSLAKRSAVFALLLILFAAGAFQVNLTERAVAASTPTADSAVQEPSDDLVKDFASRVAGSSYLAKRFAAVLQTPSGRSVLLERIEQVGKQIPAGVRREGTVRWIEENFEKRDGQYVFRAGREEHRKALLESSALYEQNATRLEVAMKNVAPSIGGQSEGAALARRFLTTENASYALLDNRLKRILQPSHRVVADIWNKYFVLDVDGGYRIRQMYLADAERTLSQLERCIKAERLLGAVFNEYAGEMVRANGTLEPSTLESRAVVAFKDPLFAAYRSVERLGHSEQPVLENANALANQLEHYIRDGSFKNEQSKGQVLEWLVPFVKLKQAHSRMQPAVREFASRIAAQSPLEEKLKRALGTRVGAVWIASAFNAEINPDAPRALENLVCRAICPKLSKLEFALNANLAKPFRGGDSLKVALDSIGRSHGVSIVPDRFLREDLGIESLDSITVKSDLFLNEITLRNAVKIILECLEGVDEPLAYVVRDGVMFITTQVEADSDGSDEEDAQRFEEKLIVHMLGEVRRFRGEAGVLSGLVESLADADVKRTLETPAGTLAVRDQVADILQPEHDGFSRWVDAYFEEVDDGWMPRAGADPVMQDIIDSAKQTKQKHADDEA